MDKWILDGSRHLVLQWLMQLSLGRPFRTRSSTCITCQRTHHTRGLRNTVSSLRCDDFTEYISTPVAALLSAEPFPGKCSQRLARITSSESNLDNHLRLTRSVCCLWALAVSRLRAKSANSGLLLIPPAKYNV